MSPVVPGFESPGAKVLLANNVAMHVVSKWSQAVSSLMVATLCILDLAIVLLRLLDFQTFKKIPFLLM